PGVRTRVVEALDALQGLGWELVDVDLDELDRVDDVLGAVVLHEAWVVHRERFERESERYGPGIRALLEHGAAIGEDAYRAGLVVPLGSVEQHGYLSLGVDRILSERVSEEAAEPLGVLVMPSLPYGLTPYFAAYPGSPTLRVETYRALLSDLLDSFYDQGFRR